MPAPHRLTSASLLLVTVLVAGSAGADGPVPPPPVAGRLARAVLLGGPALGKDDLPADLPSADRLRLLGYIDRRSTFVSLQKEAAGSADEPPLALEREIASVIEKPGIEKEAWEIAWTVPNPKELGQHAEAEAEWAEGVLRARPGTVAAPYLYAFLASRYRLMFEQAPDGDRSALERLARKYRTMLERTRTYEDSLFKLLAEDLDRLPRLGDAATRHPREYLPDT